MVDAVRAKPDCAASSARLAVITGPDSGPPAPGDAAAWASFSKISGAPGWTTFGEGKPLLGCCGLPRWTVFVTLCTAGSGASPGRHRSAEGPPNGA